MRDSTTMADIVAFYDGQLDRMKSYNNGNNGRLYKVKQSLSQFVKPGMSVLDVGCGIGVTSQHMAKLGATVLAIDIAPKLIEYARLHLSHENVSYMVKNIRDLDEPGSFDAIILADVFEHIVREDLFQAISRLLKYHTTEQTKVYLNIPGYSFSKFMNEHYPEKMQIVDEAWKIDDVVSLFANWQFVPCAMRMYGTDVIGQYVEYLFVHENSLAGTYKEQMKIIYGG